MTTLTMKFTVYWDMTPSSLKEFTEVSKGSFAFIISVLYVVDVALKKANP
jgi:hypothetical protein